MPPTVADATLRSTVRVFEAHDGKILPTAQALKTSRQAIYHRLKLAEERLGLVPNCDIPVVEGRIKSLTRQKRALPGVGHVRRYLCTSAQNNTYVHAEFWDNLLALAAHYAAELLVSRYTYNKARYGAKSVKPGKEPVGADFQDLWYDECILPYCCDVRTELAPGLHWCGEANIQPTAVNPLSGFETYTGRSSGIFPHAKIAMASVASAKRAATKFNYTTGTVTQRNYIQKKAGLKAEFAHGYAALLVEVDSDGDWFVRQIQGTDDGTIQDLDVCVVGGVVTTGHRVTAITWGDVHAVQIDPTVRSLAWGPGGMLDQLQPEYQFFHDALDMASANPYERSNPHARFGRFVMGMDNVEREVQLTADFLNDAHRPWCKGIVVASNHDRWLKRWLQEGDYRTDPHNALFFLEAQYKVYRAMAQKVAFDVVAWALRRAGAPKTLRYLGPDDSFVICRMRDGGIECGMHGHLGPDGQRGSAVTLAKMGRPANIGHLHSAQIRDGIWIAGHSANPDMGYNQGPSSWSHSHIITYPNGKRAMVTMWNGKWRAMIRPIAKTTSPKLEPRTSNRDSTKTRSPR